ncbi:hypothetical protein X728_05660 [Mesorhizobium sp. L103C120A0]|nr:hypothetical protein X728_05660 [Mesorhizobium sp. L103C120A0]
MMISSRGSAAPHCLAGHFSPYSDREKDAFIGDFANRPSCLLLPFYGEKVPAGG